jgi:hypothetical protein
MSAVLRHDPHLHENRLRSPNSKPKQTKAIHMVIWSTRNCRFARRPPPNRSDTACRNLLKPGKHQDLHQDLPRVRAGEHRQRGMMRRFALLAYRIDHPDLS